MSNNLIFKDRKSENPNRRKLTVVDEKTNTSGQKVLLVDAERAEGEVYEEGTVLNAQFFEDLKNYLVDAVSMSIPSSTYVVTNLDSNWIWKPKKLNSTTVTIDYSFFPYYTRFETDSGDLIEAEVIDLSWQTAITVIETEKLQSKKKEGEGIYTFRIHLYYDLAKKILFKTLTGSIKMEYKGSMDEGEL